MAAIIYAPGSTLVLDDNAPGRRMQQKFYCKYNGTSNLT
jgi:hypothetical protein